MFPPVYMVIDDLKFILLTQSKDHFVYAPNQWEMVLHCHHLSLAGRMHRMIAEKLLFKMSNEILWYNVAKHNVFHWAFKYKLWSISHKQKTTFNGV